MSKAILILDMPNSCEECPCYQAEMNYETIDYHYCGADYHKITESYKRNNCPLKPLPEKKHNNGGYRVIDGTEWFYDSEHDDGWTDCLDEILRGEE